MEIEKLDSVYLMLVVEEGNRLRLELDEHRGHSVELYITLITPKQVLETRCIRRGDCITFAFTDES